MGPCLVHKLQSLGHYTRCLVRSTSNKKEELEKLGAELITADITRAETLQGTADNIDVVLHLATLGHMNNFVAGEKMFEEVNVQGTRNMMEEAIRARVNRFVYCSSVAAMGIPSEVPATEKTVCNPHHAYGRSKLKAEQNVLKQNDDKKLHTVIIRFSMVYGQGDKRDMLKLTRLAQKGLFPKIGHRPKLTPLIHVKDAVQGLLLAAAKGRPGEIYLITNQQSEPFDQLRKIIQDALGIRRIPLYIPEWGALAAAIVLEKLFSFLGKVPPVSRKNIESTLADRIFSIEKAQKELNFAPQIDPEQGLKETVLWYKKKGWV